MRVQLSVVLQWLEQMAKKEWDLSRQEMIYLWTLAKEGSQISRQKAKGLSEWTFTTRDQIKTRLSDQRANLSSYIVSANFEAQLDDLLAQTGQQWNATDPAQSPRWFSYIHGSLVPDPSHFRDVDDLEARKARVGTKLHQLLNHYRDDIVSYSQKGSLISAVVGRKRGTNLAVIIGSFRAVVIMGKVTKTVLKKSA